MCKYVYTRRAGKYIYYGIKDPRIPRIIEALSGKKAGVDYQGSAPDTAG
jgi:hypothetical protein